MKKHIKTVNKAMINKTLRTGGCGECLHARLPARLAIRFANTNNQFLQKTSVLNSSLLMRGAVFI